MLERQPDGQWPLWRAPKHVGKDPSGYGGIASFVTPQVLETLFFRAGQKALIKARTGRSGADLDQLVVEHLWDGLVQRELVYAEPPWHPAEGQRIRDAEWLLRGTDRGSGTCVDLSLLFAGACLNEGLDSYLLMLRGDDSAHVAVAVRLGFPAAKSEAAARERKADPWLPDPVAETSVPGVLAISDRTGLAEIAAAERLLLIDVTVATSDGQHNSLAEAETAAWAELAKPKYHLAHLVDIAVRQYGCDDEQLELPLRRGALRTRIAPHKLASIPYRAHAEAREGLRSGGGRVVVRGPQGVGKSTLARDIALHADHGYGWFLNASSNVAFQTALAEAELSERGETPRELEAPDREALARDALDRLRRSGDSWVIVLDNANAGAEPFDEAPAVIDRLPAPKPGQLIIATSTAGQKQWPAWTVVELPTVAADELAEHGDGLAARLSAGRPLLMTAFTSLFTADPWARDNLPNSSLPEGTRLDDDAAARRAADEYWAAAHESLRRHAHPEGTDPDGAAAIACAERLAWLPPDRIEPAASGAPAAVTEVLTERGLLSQSAAPGAYAMHRLFGEAIRKAAGDRTEAVVRTLLAAPSTRRTLLQHGDADVTGQLAAALGSTSDGLALWALGAIQEVYQAKASAGTFARAAERLDVTDPEQARALADCLHAAGRVVNQKKKEDSGREEVAEAIAGMYRAIGMRPAEDVVEIAKHLALLALLRQRAVRYMTDPAAKLAELRAVMQAYEDSWQLRLKELGEADPLVDRAYYNRAGVRITLAKEDPANAVEYLKEAEQVYRATAAFRKRYYNGPNPITAAAVNGIGIAGFYGVLYGVVTEPDAVLEEAINSANEALVMRRQTSIPGDIVKSAGLLVKLGTLQAVFTSAREAPEWPAGRDLSTGKLPADIGEVISELDKRAQALGQLGVTLKRLRALGLRDDQIRDSGSSHRSQSRRPSDGPSP